VGPRGGLAAIDATPERLADAILDRLAHNAHKFTLTGDSMRKKKGGGSIRENDKHATLEG